ncbi:GerAB/ArcD/ProY family transporter [Sediminibacillus massiliensis]|uniref:GerAB/ArcD/ProY family transporter n=1 Tax=Sediminibacillus massiliensis TaxID=1926277 RepID=UPI00098838F9|nr:endospore germination permease [Sediminibacillus massiliensis]
MLRITHGQMLSIIILSQLVQIYVYSPAYMAQHVKQHVWLPLLLAIILSLLIGWGMLTISRFFAGDSFLVVLQRLTGKFLGGIIGLLYFVYFFILFVIHTQMIVTTFKSLFLPRTPTYATLILVLILALYCSLLGIEVLARASNMVMLLFILVLLFLILAVLPNIHVSYYLPLLPRSTENLWYGTLIPFMSMGQVVIISAIYPFVNYKEETAKVGWLILGIFFALLITSMVVLESVGAFSAFELERLRYPTVELITLIQVGEFMERLEIFLVTMWAGAVLMVIGILFTIACYTFKQVFQRNNMEAKVLNLLLIFTSFILIVLFVPNSDELISFIFGRWVYISLLFQAVMPIALLLIFFIRTKVMKYAKH